MYARGERKEKFGNLETREAEALDDIGRRTAQAKSSSEFSHFSQHVLARILGTEDDTPIALMYRSITVSPTLGRVLSLSLELIYLCRYRHRVKFGFEIRV